MGACTSNQKPIKNPPPASMPTKQLPLTYYVNRKRCRLLKIENNKVTKIPLPVTKKFRMDSGIGLTREGNIFMVGGTDSLKNLTRSFFKVDPPQEKVDVLPDLPFPAK